MDSCGGDTYQDCDSFCGPSFNMQRHQPMFKARKHYNTWLASDESEDDNDDGVDFVPSSEIAPTRSSAPSRSKARTHERPPPPPPPPLPGSSRRRRALQNAAATDSTNSDCSGCSQARSTKPNKAAIQTYDSSAADCCQGRQQQRASLGHRRRHRVASVVRPAADQQERTTEAAPAAPSIQTASPPSHRSAGARIKRKMEPQYEEPIDYMEVYHRLRVGRFGLLHNFPSFRESSPTAAAPTADWSQRPLKDRHDSDGPMAAAVAAASAATAVTPAASATTRKAKGGRGSVATIPATRQPSAERNTDLEHLLRLLRDGGRRGVSVCGAAAGLGLAGELSLSSQSASPLPLPSPPLSLPPSQPLTPLPPVPKPRQSTSRTTSSRSEAAPPPAACEVSHQTASAASAHSAASGATRQTLSASLASCGPFESAVVIDATPFEQPRRCRLTPTLVTPAAELAPSALSCLNYRCADWLIQRRLSVTGRLLDRHHGAAPCRWLRSSALLTQLRHPSRLELAVQAQSLTEATTATVRVRPPGKLCVARSCGDSPPPARFAFHAMSSRRSTRSRGRSGRDGGHSGSGRSKSNLYAVSVS